MMNLLSVKLVENIFSGLSADFVGGRSGFLIFVSLNWSGVGPTISIFFKHPQMILRVSLVAQLIKNPSAVQEIPF